MLQRSFSAERLILCIVLGVMICIALGFREVQASPFKVDEDWTTPPSEDAPDPDEDNRKMQEKVGRILNELASTEGEHQQNEIIAGLLDMGDTAAPYLLMAFQESNDWDLKKQILKIFILSKGPAALDMLLELVTDHSNNPSWRREIVLFGRDVSKMTYPRAVYGLTRLSRSSDRAIGGKTSGALQKIHQTYPNSGVREAITWEIKRTMELGMGEESELIRMVKVLAIAGNAETMPPLEELARSENETLRSASIWTIAKLYPEMAGSMRERDRDRILRRLYRALRDKSTRVRAEAARAFGTVKERRASPDLIVLLADKSPAVKAAALKALNDVSELKMDDNIEAWTFWWEKQGVESLEEDE